MKRLLPNDFNNHKVTMTKKTKTSSFVVSSVIVLNDENLLYEIFKHVDAKTLGSAACVSRKWHRTTEDERLWEMICMKNSVNIGISCKQLRLVVLALGGFRCLHSRYLVQLSKPLVAVTSSSSSSSSTTVAAATSMSVWPCLPQPSRVVIPAKQVVEKTRWGKDEIQLSLSLLSIRYFEKLNFNNRNI